MTAPDPDPHGVTALAAALGQRFDPDAPRWWGKGVVTSVAGTTASVQVPGDTLEMASTGWYQPRVGDVVFCIGPPGQWLILGPVGNATAAVSTGPSTVSGGQTITGGQSITGGVTVDTLTSTGGIRATTGLSTGGDFIADYGVRAKTGLSTGGDLVVDGRSRATNWSSSTVDGAINWDPTGALQVMNYAGNAFRGVYASNFAPPPSWREYKVALRALVDVLGCEPGEVIDRLRVEQSWKYDPARVSFADGVERIGPMLDEVPDALIVRSYDEDGNDTSSWSVNGMVTVLIAELQTLRRRVAELEDRGEQ